MIVLVTKTFTCRSDEIKRCAQLPWLQIQTFYIELFYIELYMKPMGWVKFGSPNR